ncbi:disease resistance-like protein DSC1 [Mangifera indica]|uniref:disease resistance-like protein DSC1 n=1 Tax=Mangifera indica TaxID=29780 RepID=UPI001CFA10A6|nr:disease resistance-like protein DSC1 [Mangifera indica]
MASSSNTHSANYDVYLSFRGKDTRDNFVSHLYAALCRSEINVFIDDEHDRGDEISASLLNAIEGSKISILVFSKGYASSRWLLEELVKILECKEYHRQRVIPVFYHVPPSDVWNQMGTFGEGFAKLEERFKERPDMLQRWRIALTEAANLSGYNTDVTRWEPDLVEVIVENIVEILDHVYPSDNKDLVGVQSSIKKIESLLCIGSKDVCIVGIWGMGGIGKTTIAQALYDEICNQFEGSYFALNVSEESESPNSLTLLRQELFASILKDGPSDSGFIFTKLRLFHKRVLLVFDDVTSLEQIKFLIGDLNCLGFGSRIIVTTRDRQVLKNYGVDDDNIYKVDPLFHHDALQLFSWYAFQQNRPAFGYNELSSRVIKYAEGVPLALKVLGSFFRGKTKSEWESAIYNLEQMPCKNIQMVLKVSYDGLDLYEKNIFLDIACFLKWESRDIIIKFLNSSGFFAEIGISVLIDRCLITVSNNRITMHALLQEMGWEIVQEECYRDPSNRSRLWNHADIHHVLKNNMGSNTIEGICLDMSNITHINLNPCAFSEMPNLRFLKAYNSHCEENSINKLCLTKDLEFVFAELSYLCWHGCPLKSLQSGFYLENLVALDMSYSDIQQLWMGDQILLNLKTINLSHSKHLQGSPDFSVTPNLESLILEDCSSLLEISSSINRLDKLVVLNLRQCKSLHSLPMSINSKFLRKVFLSSCSNLEKFPRISSDIEELYLDESAIKELALSIENPSRLVTLNFKGCSSLENLPSNICHMKSLEHLDVSGCSKLDGLLDNLGNLEALKVLKLEKLAQREVSSSIVCLHFLKELNLTDCGIVKLPGSLGQLSTLESLFLGRNNFESIPTGISDLHKLSYLDLSYCQRLQSLPELPSELLYLDASSCTSLEATSNLLFTLSTYIGVSFFNCFKLKQNEHIDHMMCSLFKSKCRRIKFDSRPFGYYCFPGNQIPEWFTFKSSGASLNQTVSDCYPTLCSFGVCAVVQFQNYQDDGHGLVVRCVCKLGNRYGKVFFYYDVGHHCIDSEHIFLGYDLHTCFFNCAVDSYIEDNEVSIQFYVEDSTGKQIDCCEVKNCGLEFFHFEVNQDQMQTARGRLHVRRKRSAGIALRRGRQMLELRVVQNWSAADNKEDAVLRLSENRTTESVLLRRQPPRE